MPTQLEAAMILSNMALHESDPARKDAILVGIHHTVRNKLHKLRNRASRAARGLSPSPVPSVPAAPVVPAAQEA